MLKTVMDMNFQSLFYFRAVQTEGSIQQAAQKLQLSPQALSEHIKRIETELGVALLNKTRPVTLTGAGERFARFANEVLLMRYRMEQDLSELDGRKKRLLISTPLRGTPAFLAEVIRDFARLHPDCAVHVQERVPNVSAQELRQYDLNLSMAELGKDLDHIMLRIEQPECVSAQQPGYVYLVRQTLLEQHLGDAWAEKLEALHKTRDIRILAEIPYIRFSDISVTNALDKQLADARFYPRIVASADSSDLCFSLCLSGVGASVIPSSWLHQHSVPDGFFTFRLPQPLNQQNLYISYEKGRELSVEEQAFLRILAGRVGGTV